MGSKNIKYPKLEQQTHMGVFPTAFIALENHCQIKWDNPRWNPCSLIDIIHDVISSGPTSEIFFYFINLLIPFLLLILLVHTKH